MNKAVIVAALMVLPFAVNANTTTTVGAQQGQKEINRGPGGGDRGPDRDPGRGNDRHRNTQVVNIGSTKLSFGRDRDLVRVPQICGLVAVRLKTTGSFLGGVNVERVSVVFGNGQRQQLQVRENFRAGSTSRWIDLRGETRCLTGFAISGSSQSFFKNAKIKMEGLQIRQGRR